MKYMLLTYGAEDCWNEDERTECMLESMRICGESDIQGKWIASSPLHSVVTATYAINYTRKVRFVSAAPLQPPEIATCVRIRDGSRVVVDGPFSETKEQLGGYLLIRVTSLDDAIAIVATIPGSRRGTAEIRPLFPLPHRLPVGNEATDPGGTGSF